MWLCNISEKKISFFFTTIKNWNKFNHYKTSPPYYNLHTIILNAMLNVTCDVEGKSQMKFARIGKDNYNWMFL